MSETADRRGNGQFQRGNRYRLRRDGEPPPPDLDPARAKLRETLARHKEEAERLDGLTAAMERCHGESRDARAALHQSETALRDLRHTDRTDLAYRYAEGAILELSHSLDVATAEVARNQAELERLSEVETALADEIKASQSRLVMRQMSLREALSAVICDSSEFRSLLERLDALHAAERGLHKAFRVISAAIGGLPAAHFRRIHRTVSRDPDVNEPIDPAVAEHWSAALAKLREDADAPLPNGVTE
jgi:hypothetical protein